MYKIAIAAIAVAIAFAIGFDIGRKGGIDEGIEIGSERAHQARDLVSRQMREAGVCRWVSLYSSYVGCDNP